MVGVETPLNLWLGPKVMPNWLISKEFYLKVLKTTLVSLMLMLIIEKLNRKLGLMLIRIELLISAYLQELLVEP